MARQFLGNLLPPKINMFLSKIVPIIILTIFAGTISYFMSNPMLIRRFVSSEFTTIDLRGKTVRIPVEWGRVITQDNPQGYFRDPNYFDAKLDTIPNLYVIDFTNDVRAYFQDGLDLVYYRKGRERKNCGEVYNKLTEDQWEGELNDRIQIEYDDNDDLFDNDCVRIEDGSFNLATGHLTVFEREFPFWGDTIHTGGPTDFEFFDRLGQRQRGFFSPRGTYVTNAGVFYEGCGMEMKDTITGQILLKPSNEEGALKEALSLDCGALLNFSEDEKIFVIRSAGVSIDGSYLSEFFIVVVGDGYNEKINVMPKLASEYFYSPENNFDAHDYDELDHISADDPRRIDALTDFRITSVADDEIRFDILKDTSLHYQTGSYVYSILKDQIIRQ